MMIARGNLTLIASEADLAKATEAIRSELDHIDTIVAAVERSIAYLIADGRVRHDPVTGRLYDQTGLPPRRRWPGVSVNIDSDGRVGLFSDDLTAGA